MISNFGPFAVTHAWTGAAGTGLWSDAGNWSVSYVAGPDGDPPPNFAPVPPDASAFTDKNQDVAVLSNVPATVLVTGATGTDADGHPVDFGQNLIVDSADPAGGPTLKIAGTLRMITDIVASPDGNGYSFAGGRIDLRSGTMLVDGGKLQALDIYMDGGGLVFGANAAGADTFDAVGVHGDFSIGAGSLAVVGSGTFLSIGALDGAPPPTVSLEGKIDAKGTIYFSGAIDIGAAGQLFLDGGSLTSFSNDGVVKIQNGLFSLSSHDANFDGVTIDGDFSIDAGERIVVESGYTTTFENTQTGAATVTVANGSTLDVYGVLDMTKGLSGSGVNTVAVSSTSQLWLDGGTLKGGLFNDLGALHVYNSGALDGAEVDLDVTLQAINGYSSAVTLTILGATQIGAATGRAITLDLNGGVLDVKGTLDFANLTIENGTIVVEDGGGIVNGADVFYSGVVFGSPTTNWVGAAGGGDDVHWSDPLNWSGGAVPSIGGDLDGGVATISNIDATVVIDGTSDNGDGTFTPAAAKQVIVDAADPAGGPAVRLVGTLNMIRQTDASGAIQTGRLDLRQGAFVVAGGALEGLDVYQEGGALAFDGGGSFSAVGVHGDLDIAGGGVVKALPSSFVSFLGATGGGSQAHVRQNTTLEADGSINFDGSISLDAGATLKVAGGVLASSAQTGQVAIGAGTFTVDTYAQIDGVTVDGDFALSFDRVEIASGYTTTLRNSATGSATITLADSSQIDVNGGALSLQGAILADAGSRVTIEQGGRITGGEIDGGAVAVTDRGALSGVTIDADVSLSRAFSASLASFSANAVAGPSPTEDTLTIEGVVHIGKSGSAHTLDLGGGTLDVVGELDLADVAVSNGTIKVETGATFVYDAASTFTGVTLQRQLPGGVTQIAGQDVDVATSIALVGTELDLVTGAKFGGLPTGTPGSATIDGFATVSGYGSVVVTDANGGASLLTVQGTIDANVAGRTLDVTSGGRRYGTLIAENGGTLKIGTAGVAAIGAGGGLLESGSYTAKAGSTIEIRTDAPIAAIIGAVTLDGAGSALVANDGTAITPLEASLLSVGASEAQLAADPAYDGSGFYHTNLPGDLTLLNGRGFAAAHALTIYDKVSLSGGTFSAPSLTFGSWVESPFGSPFGTAGGGSIVGFGEVRGALSGYGLVDAQGGSLTLDDALSGYVTLRAETNATLVVKGSLAGNANGATQIAIAQGATVEIDGDANGAGVTFGGEGATFAVKGAVNDSFSIGGALKNTQIHLIGESLLPGHPAATFARTSAGSLVATVYLADGTDTFTITGDVAHTGFKATSDGAGGTFLKFGDGSDLAEAVIEPGPKMSVSGGLNYVFNDAVHESPGTSLSDDIVIVNKDHAAAGQGTLSGAITSTSGPLTATGGFDGLKPGASTASLSGTIVVGSGAPINVTIDTSHAGLVSGSVALGFTSVNQISGQQLSVPLNPQTVTVSAKVYRLGAIDTTEQVFHVHQTLPGDANYPTETLKLAVKNTAATDGYSEGVTATVTGVSGDISGGAGSIPLLAAGATNASGVTFKASTDASAFGDGAQHVQHGSVTLAVKSDGTGTSGLGVTDVGSASIPVEIEFDQLAKPNVPTTTFYVHQSRPGSTDSVTYFHIPIQNLAPASFSDDLIAAVKSQTGYIAGDPDLEARGTTGRIGGGQTDGGVDDVGGTAGSQTDQGGSRSKNPTLDSLNTTAAMDLVKSLIGGDGTDQTAPTGTTGAKNPVTSYLPSFADLLKASNSVDAANVQAIQDAIQKAQTTQTAERQKIMQDLQQQILQQMQDTTLNKAKAAEKATKAVDQYIRSLSSTGDAPTSAGLNAILSDALSGTLPSLQANVQAEKQLLSYVDADGYPVSSPTLQSAIDAQQAIIRTYADAAANAGQTPAGGTTVPSQSADILRAQAALDALQAVLKAQQQAAEGAIKNVPSNLIDSATTKISDYASDPAAAGAAAALKSALNSLNTIDALQDGDGITFGVDADLAGGASVFQDSTVTLSFQSDGAKFGYGLTDLPDGTVTIHAVVNGFAHPIVNGVDDPINDQYSPTKGTAIAKSLNLGTFTQGASGLKVTFTYGNLAVAPADSLDVDTDVIAGGDGFNFFNLGGVSGLAPGGAALSGGFNLDTSGVGTHTVTIEFSPYSVNPSDPGGTALTPIDFTYTFTVVKKPVPPDPQPPIDPPPPPPSPTGSILGDPHLTTFDGTHYDFQAAGEFVVAKSKAPGDTFEVQARMEPTSPDAHVSVINAVAVQFGANRVSIDSSRARPVWLDGSPITLGVDGSLDLAGGTLHRVGASQTYVVTAKTGEVVSYNGGVNLNIALAGSASVGPGMVEGLLGDDDGSAANDLRLADGTVLGNDLTFAQLYGAYADAWRVSDATSLFDYAAGASTATYTNKNFPPAPVTLASLPDDLVARATAAVQAAGVTDPRLAADAILDYALTNNDQYIAAAAQAQQASAPIYNAEVKPTAAPPPPAKLVSVTATDMSFVDGTQATFQVERTGATDSQLVVHYTVTTPGGGYLSAADFGGVAPSGTATIDVGFTTAVFSVLVPSVGANVSEKLQVTIDSVSDAAATIVTPSAQTLIVNHTPTEGVDAIAAFTEFAGGGVLTHVGNAYTLDLGAIVRGGDAPTLRLGVANLAAAGANLITGGYALGAGDGSIALTSSANGPYQLAGGQVSGGLNFLANNGTLGRHSQVVTLSSSQSNATGFFATLGDLTLTIVDTVVDLPVVNDQIAAVNQGATLTATGGVGGTGALAGDADPNGGTLRITALQGFTVGSPAQSRYGTLTLKADGSYSYAAGATDAQRQALAAAGAGVVQDVFAFTATDDAGVPVDARLTVTVNRPPTAAAHQAAVAAGGTVDLAGLDHDPDGGAVTVSLVAGGAVGVALAGAYGSVTITADDAIHYSADAAAAIAAAPLGAHPLDTFTYSAADAKGATADETIAFVVNRAPTVASRTVTAANAGAASGALAGASDPDGDALAVVSVAGATVGQTVAGTFGDLTLQADGSYVYVVGASPAEQQAYQNAVAGGVAPSDAFAFVVSDGHGAAVGATLTVKPQTSTQVGPIVDERSATGGVYVDLGAGVAYVAAPGTGFHGGFASATVASSQRVSGATGVIGSAFDDRLYGSSGANLFQPGRGSDIVYGGGGADTVSYSDLSAGVYVELGGRFAYKETTAGVGWRNVAAAESGANGFTVDTLVGVGRVVGTAFDDRFYGGTTAAIFAPGMGADVVVAGAGGATVDYSTLAGGAFVDLGGRYALKAKTAGAIAGGVDQDALVGVENAIGTALGDRLYGDAKDNVFSPGAGADVVYGGGGRDTVDYSGLAAGVYVDLSHAFAYKETAAGVGWSNPGVAETGVGNGFTTDYLGGMTNAVGTAFDDRLYGRAAGGGALYGGAGNDVLYAHGGGNALDGGAGDDMLVASGGDTLTGGAGADGFVFVSPAAGGDVIADFAPGVDALKFASGAFGSYTTGQSVSLSAGTGTSDAIFGARTTQGFAYDTSTGRLWFDADGSGAAAPTLMATLTGALTLSATDLKIY